MVYGKPGHFRFFLRWSLIWKQTALVVFLAVVSSGAQATLTCSVVPENINVNIGYGGSDITITGTGASGDGLIIKIQSPPVRTVLKYKGKAGGLLWMKLGEITYENLPSLYLLYSSRPLDGLLPAQELTRYGLGYAVLINGARVQGEIPNIDRQKWLREFIKFKEAQNLYHEDLRAVQVDSAGDRYLLKLRWPFEVPPGNYTVQVLAVSGGRVVSRAATEIRVRQGDLVRKLSALAQDRGAIYGLLAVFLAAAAGIGVGLFFKRRGGH